MILEETAFQALQGIYVGARYPTSTDDETISRDVIYTFVLELVNMNYILDRTIIDELCKLSLVKGTKLLNHYLKMIRKHLGAHVKHEPFYPNFPKQVMDASNLELFLNAIFHYYTWGKWKPVYVKEKRVESCEESKLVKLHLVTENELKEFFIKLISSNTGIPIVYDDFIKQAITLNWFDSYKAKFSEVPFRQTSCKLAVECLKGDKDISYFVKTTTDVLRIIAVYSEQPADLKRIVKFKSMKRHERRKLIRLLEEVINVEDVKRYTSVWIRAFHCLHVGEYWGKVKEISARFRNENNVHTKNTKLCQAIENSDVDTSVGILKNLSSMFARYLDKLLRDSSDDEKVLQVFIKIAKSVDSRILLQALGRFKGNNKVDKRTVFANQSLIMIPKKENQNVLSNSVVVKVVDIIHDILIEKFKLLNNFNQDSKVYITKEAEGILLPLQLNTGSNSNKRALARGSRLIPDECDRDKNFIRIFTHWIGKIVDIAAVFFKEDLVTTSFINWTHLKEDFAVHSGDIIDAPAPDGASEFIDIDINRALEEGYRYIEMSVKVWSGPTFAKHEECFGGFMMRQEQQSGEIFEPSTVRVKVDLTSDTRDINPFMFDLKAKELIWLDIPSRPKLLSKDISGYGDIYYTNTVNHQINAMKEALKACLELPLIKVNMKELLELHVQAGSATIVENKEDANFIIGLGEGDLDLYDFTTINSKWF